MKTLFKSFIKAANVLVAVVFAAMLVYRANNFIDPHGPSVVVPLMCVILGMLVIGSTVALTFRSQGTPA